MSSPSDRLKRWLFASAPGAQAFGGGTRPPLTPEGLYEEERGVRRSYVWWQALCLMGVGYFSTLAYLPGIAFLAAGALSPLATAVLVAVTLFGALPVYRRVAKGSSHGGGSLSMLERLLPFWQGKLLVLALLGFLVTDLVLTITLSAADAAAHLAENPWLGPWLGARHVAVTVVIVALLGAAFLRGVRQLLGVAVALVAAYLALGGAVIVHGLLSVAAHPDLLASWRAALGQAQLRPGDLGVPALLGAAALLLPRLSVGFSGFETGVAVMPLVRGDPDDAPSRPRGRIRNARKLLTAAALIMGLYLLGASAVTTLLIPAEAFQNAADTPRPRAECSDAGLLAQARAQGQTLELMGARCVLHAPAGAANGRALAYLAHRDLGAAFGGAFDLVTVLILCLAGASALAALLNVVPRYLPRYGMAPEWAEASRPLVLLFTGVALVITLLYRADVNAQAGAYATGVLVLITAAAVAAALASARRFERASAAFYGAVALVFALTTLANFVERPEGWRIASVFILAIVVLSFVSRAARATELRVERVELSRAAERILIGARGRPIRFVAHHPQGGEDGAAEYRFKAAEARLGAHVPEGDPIVFVEVLVADASEFSNVLEVEGREVAGYQVLRARGNSVPNAIAALLLFARDATGAVPHVYFDWNERGPLQNAARFVLGGQGDVALVTHEILRLAERDRDQRPMVHLGG